MLNLGLHHLKSQCVFPPSHQNCGFCRSSD